MAEILAVQGFRPPPGLPAIQRAPSAWLELGCHLPPTAPNPQFRQGARIPKSPPQNHPSEPARELPGHFHQIIHTESWDSKRGLRAPEGTQVWEDGPLGRVLGPLSQPNLGLLSYSTLT